MNTKNISKLNFLMQNWPKNVGSVVTDSTLRSLGISKDLKHSYIRNNWLESIGTGASIRAGETPNWKAALFALQEQLGIGVHIAGKTALSLRGMSHFVEFNILEICLFTTKGTILPQWFKNYDWDVDFKITRSNFLPENIFLSQEEIEGFALKISSPERAIMELIYFIPISQGFEEAYFIIENLITLRPNILQELLEKCTSIKVKRIFLYLAERINHPWFTRLDLRKIDLGSGKRQIIDDGFFDSKYQITVPRSLKNEE
jgi:hypothetical protein